MKRITAPLLVLALCLFPALAKADGKSVKVCDNVTINASSVASGITYCTPIDVSGYTRFAYQIKCVDASDTPQFDVDFVMGSAASTDYWGVPVALVDNGTTTVAIAILQLLTNSTAETWSTYRLINLQPIPGAMATLKITNDVDEADVTCTAWLHMAN